MFVAKSKSHGEEGIQTRLQLAVGHILAITVSRIGGEAQYAYHG